MVPKGALKCPGDTSQKVKGSIIDPLNLIHDPLQAALLPGFVAEYVGAFWHSLYKRDNFNNDMQDQFSNNSYVERGNGISFSGRTNYRDG
jgi:hypothetical protein